MISLPPVVNGDNIAYSAGFFPLKGKVKETVLKIIKKECVSEYAFKGFQSLQLQMAAMLLGQLMYSSLNSPYVVYTEELKTDYKERINYDKFKECFNCHGIDIDLITESFGYDDP